MEKIRNLIKTVAGSLGWGMMGGMMLVTEIGPAWLGWVAVIVASCSIAGAVDKAMTPEQRW